MANKIVTETKQTLVKIKEKQLRRSKMTKVELQELVEPSVYGADEFKSIGHEKEMHHSPLLDYLGEGQSSDFHLASSGDIVKQLAKHVRPSKSPSSSKFKDKGKEKDKSKEKEEKAPQSSLTKKMILLTWPIRLLIRPSKQR